MITDNKSRKQFEEWYSREICFKEICFIDFSINTDSAGLFDSYEDYEIDVMYRAWTASRAAIVLPEKMLFNEDTWPENSSYYIEGFNDSLEKIRHALDKG